MPGMMLAKMLGMRTEGFEHPRQGLFRTWIQAIWESKEKLDHLILNPYK